MDFSVFDLVLRPAAEAETLIEPTMALMSARERMQRARLAVTVFRIGTGPGEEHFQDRADEADAV